MSSAVDNRFSSAVDRPKGLTLTVLASDALADRIFAREQSSRIDRCPVFVVEFGAERPLMVRGPQRPDAEERFPKIVPLPPPGAVQARRGHPSYRSAKE